MKQKIKEEIKKFLVVDRKYEIIPDDIIEAIDLAISKTEKVTAKRLLKHYENMNTRPDEIFEFMASEDFAPIDKVNYCNDRVEDAIKKTAKEIIEQINNAQLELCKEENYSLNGDKKICCISELMVLEKELKKKFGVK